VPASLMGVDVAQLLRRAAETAAACHEPEPDANPGLELGLRLGEGWRDGRDKVCVDESPTGFGLWAEQLLAESTGKQGKGLVPAPGEPAEGPDRQRGELRLDDPYDLGAELYRWEFATAAAGEPDVEPRGDLDELLALASEGDYVCVQAFVDPAREAELAPLLARARETGCVVTCGLGPRYLHSTGQLHKGGANTGLFVQVVDDTGDELPIPGRDFGFGRLIRSQAAGDFAALEERGRRAIRLRLEDL
jgi:transaldolase / glucose-6-phosphate isomerase